MHTFQNDIVIDVNRNHSCRRFLLDPIETRLLGVSHLDFEIALGRPCPKSWKIISLRRAAPVGNIFVD